MSPESSEAAPIGVFDSGVGGKREDPVSFYNFTSFTDPGTIYKYDYATGKSEVFYRPELKFDPAQFITEHRNQ